MGWVGLVALRLASIDFGVSYSIHRNYLRGVGAWLGRLGFLYLGMFKH